MAARKLQTELDRTFKRIQEGVEVFESIYEKMQQATNQAQKEKLENDLKTSIKKLQRMRDQIKTWLASNEIKDKQQLTDYRKLIETQMERFKACEKEMKTKAFSRAGLDAAAKLDPKEKLKQELADWIGNIVDDLGRQVESAEADIEGMQGGTKKKKDTKLAARVADLEHGNDRRKWHVSRLEIVLRLLENGSLDPDKLQDSSFKDDVKYYVESNTEEDFEEDEGIYDDWHLDQEEEAFGMLNDDVLSSHDSHSVADANDVAPIRTPLKESPAAQKAKIPVAATEVDSPSVKKAPQRKATLDGTTARPVIPATKAIPAVPALPSPAPAPKVAQTAPLRYASAAASALAPPPATAAAAALPSAPSPPVAISASAAAISPAPEAPMVSPSALKSPAANAPPGLPALPTNAPPGLDPPTPAAAQPIPAATAPSPVEAIPAPEPTPPPPAAQRPSSPLKPLLPPSRTVSSASTQGPSAPLARPPSAADSATAGANRATPSSLADLVTTFEGAKGKAMRKDPDMGAIHQILESGYSNVPQAQDADKPKYYTPKHPHNTPSYYPTTPLPHLETPALFHSLDLDTLFYVFYGTFLQYLAAQELKKQSWRFHKQYLTWFQRANEPSVITDEYEQGVYLYFDWESAWSTRRKNSFAFYYAHLSDW